jgi:hypothetical protein
MKVLVNRFIFSESNLDCGSLGVLSSVAHKFAQERAYYATVLRGSKAVGRFSVLVTVVRGQQQQQEQQQ